MTFTEAVVNAMKYGNKLDPGLTVSVDVEISDDTCTIRVGDSGKDRQQHRRVAGIYWRQTAVK